MVSRLAPAKINLYLHVTGRRPDGFHLLDSLFAFADFGDSLEVGPGSDDIHLSIDGPFAKGLPAVGDNLVVKAARAIADFARERAIGTPPFSADIRLVKSLPVAAGIGGGSSDAAAILHALNEFWDIGAGLDDLAALAATLGADIPACLHALPVQASGIGEVLTPAVALPDCALLLVNPGVPLLTPDVFRLFAARPVYSGAAPLDHAPSTLDSLAEQLRARRNDLQPAAEQLVPAISAVLARIGQSRGCALSRLSGSGPTCFGLFPSLDEADAAAAAIAAARPGWWVRSGHIRSGRDVDGASRTAAVAC